LNSSETIEELKSIITALIAENTDLKVRNELLEKRIKELETQIKADSQNSSKPPSTDGYKKKPALSKPQTGKVGGQPGHKGHTLLQIGTPDQIVVQHLCTCSECGCNLTTIEGTLFEKRQVYEIPEPRLNVIEYQTQKAECPHCHSMQYSTFPEGVNAPVQYGSSVKALVTLLNVVYKIPFKKVCQLFADLFKYQINESTVVSSGETCYKRLENTEKNIIAQILASFVAHFDETGIRVKGSLQWLHTATTILHTYLWVHSKRGCEALNSTKSIIGKFSGWAVHDCWVSYFGYTEAKHSVCGAHLIREFEALKENGSLWAKEFQTFLLDIYYFRKQNPNISKPEWYTQYDTLCAKAELEEPPPKISGKKGKNKRTKGRNLLVRLTKHKDAVLAFAYHDLVPFTNNQAERDIRPAKVKQKVSGCFRTFHGAEIYARIEGYVSSLRKNQLNIFKELTKVFSGTNFDFCIVPK